MRLLALAACLPLIWLPAAHAEEAARRAEVAAATADARESLLHDILATELQPGVTVDDLLTRTGGADPLKKVVDEAEPVGGTRWIDDATCEIRIEVEGAAVEKAVLQSAEASPDHSPVPLQSLRIRLQRWRQRTFASTGTSTALAAAEQLHPGGEQKVWQPVGDEPRRKAIADARLDAINRVLDSIRPITMPDGQALGDALEVPVVNSQVEAWLESRPITSVEFRDDLEVRLMLAVDARELWKVVEAAIQHQHKVALPAGDAGWKNLRVQVERRAADPVGRAVVATAQPTTHQAPLLPDQPPRWIDQTMDAEGVARSHGSLLKTARAAEAIAGEKLAARLGDLPLGDKLTVADAAGKDKRVAEALSRAVARAHTFRVEYNTPEPGAVKVRVSLRLVDLWRELASR